MWENTVTTLDFCNFPKKEKIASSGGLYSSGNNGNSIDYLDAFRRKLQPDSSRLVAEYKRIIYSCANVNADVFTNVPLRLYLRTTKGQKKSYLPTRQLKSKELERLVDLGYTKQIQETEEVLDHPVLDLFKHPNSARSFNFYKLWSLTQLYQEVTGKAYWHIKRSNSGIPPIEEIWLIPSQYLTPKREIDSNKLVDYYEYKNGMKEKKFSVDEIVPFLMGSLNDPYLDGLGPLQASFEAYGVNAKILSHESSILDNQARPDSLIIPKGETSYDATSASRLEKQLNQKLQRGGNGKLIVLEEEAEWNPLVFPPKDLGLIEIGNYSKLDIANAFAVPIALINSEKVNKATLEAAMTQHALMSILPRCRRRDAVLNDQIIPLYDPSERLFFCSDDPVPENRETKLKEVVQLVMNGIYTPNEGRDEYDMPPVSGGDKLRPINVSPEAARQSERDNGNAVK